MVKTKTTSQWQSYIGTSLKRTAEATLDTAKRVSEYRNATKEDEFNKSMKEWFGMSPSHLSYWSKINEQLPRFLDCTGALPSSTRTLYELSGLDDSLWEELVETGDINPALTVEGAKNLKINGGLKKAIARKYGEADNFLEIMQELGHIMAIADSVSIAKSEITIWLKDNPAKFYDDDETSTEYLPDLDEDGNEIPLDGYEPKESQSIEKVIGISSQKRVKALAIFGIFVDKPIIDKDLLTFLDTQAGNDDIKITAIKTLEDE